MAATAHGVRRSPAPRTPRRVSGPARPKAVPPTRTARKPTAAPVSQPLVIRGLAKAVALADARVLQVLIARRWWVPLVAVSLMGIVFLQVSMLKMNAGIGRAVATSQTLERQNATLRTSVARLDSGERIEGIAIAQGMVSPPAGAVTFLRPGGSQTARRAAASIRDPKPVTITAPVVVAAPVAPVVAQAPAPPTTTAPAPTTTAAPPAQAATQPPAQTAPPAQQPAATPSAQPVTPSGGAAAPAAGTP